MTQHPRDIREIASRLLKWYSANARDLPWRRSRDPYAIWVSEVMLQQTQVKTVVPYWERWMNALPDLAALARARPERVQKLWEGLGYYSRARNLQRAAQRICDHHAGVFPRDYASILDLPGIGRYTAGAVCSIAFDQPRPILDGNVFRVLSRLFGIAGDRRNQRVAEKFWRLAEELVAAADRSPRRPGARAPGRDTKPHMGRCGDLNQSLMELGALVCTPRAPSCACCPVRSQCVAYHEDRVDELPSRSPRAKTSRRHFVAFVPNHQDCFLVRRRPAKTLNARLWEFPNAEVNGRHVDLPGLARDTLGMAPSRIDHLVTLHHTITRYRIRLDVFRAALPRRPPVSDKPSRWQSLAALRQLAFSAAHRKILDLLAEDPVGGHPQRHRL